MNCPSVKRIQSVLGISKEYAKRIRDIMEGPGFQLERLDKIDSVLGTFGVEYIEQGHNSKSPAIEYCNTGDTYKPTVMLINGRFQLGCWGDIVERGNYD